MKISDLYAAKGEKVKLRALSRLKQEYAGKFVRLRQIGENEFQVAPFGCDSDEFIVDKPTADNIKENIELEKNGSQWNFFVAEETIHGQKADHILVQIYTFASKTEYTTPIIINISEGILEKTSIDEIKNKFVFNDIGEPAIFALRYKDNKKTDIRLISEKQFLHIKNTPRGLIATNLRHDRDKTNMPIDVYFAPDIQFVRESESKIGDEKFSQDLDNISSAATYFDRWDAYNKLASKEMANRKSEFGEIKYLRYEKMTTENGFSFMFSVEESPDKSLYGESLAVKDAAIFKDGNPGEVWVGKISRIDNACIETILEKDDAIINIPDKGSLVLSDIGDRFIIRRRNKAKDRMLSGHSPIRKIVGLIEEGVSEYFFDSNWTFNPAITSELEKNFPKSKSLNAQQQKALDLAINTPDIAIIQGPPGTGKTTLIKAICERFQEIFERDNGSRPRILISSFQNDAVDNAISNALPGDLPAFRIGKKRETNYKASIDAWVAEVKQNLTAKINEKSFFELAAITSNLSDSYYSYRNTGEKIQDGIRIIESYLNINDMKFPDAIRENALRIVKQYKQRIGSGVVEQDEIVPYIQSLRIKKEAFSDDGLKCIKRLLAHIKNRTDLVISQEVLDNLHALLDNGVDNQENFTNYIYSVKVLQDKYCPTEEKVNIDDTTVIDDCIQELAASLDVNKYSLAVNLEAKKSLVVGEFLERFENEAQDLVQKYSLTTAATCQQALSLSGNNDESYNLVIVDEAARATPLDLFIPMSMGRKIILVGDHKQLPHMLEPDVLKLILEDPQYKDLSGLEISLFERLFDMFSRIPRPKALLLDTQYRMHPDISTFVSEAFYNNELKSGVTVDERLIPNELFNGKALAYINITKNKGMEHGGISKSRPEEAKAIANDVKKVITKCPDKTIGIISFYSAQKERILEEISKELNAEQMVKIECGTVDAFQGKEFDYVFLSCVRSNNYKNDEKKSVGFLVKPNRICVALSRAKYHLSVYGDSETINAVPCFKLLYEKCKEKGEGYYHEY
ncbi:AAA domain-containing protein [Treponema primitia]|uniref:AAA domain-containing protein n=1 Tax=Treponema primitia TaxID=88058 RepID=UPI00398153A2